MDGHHLILGDLEDYITGEILKDTHDERYRQKVSRILVEQKGFLRPDISPRLALFVRAGDKCAIIKIDLCSSAPNDVRCSLSAPWLEMPLWCT